MNNFTIKETIKTNHILFLLSGLAIAFHLYSNLFANYGIFRDELYYLACANRPDIGYVDHPPFSIYILKVITLILGNSLFAIRLLPAIIHGYIIFMTGLLTKKIGGSNMAVITAALAILLAPTYLAFSTFYSMNIIGFALWVTGFFIIIKIIQEEGIKYWIYLGFLIGIGLLNKIVFLWFGASLFFGLLLTENRKYLKTPYPYYTALIALIIFSPFIIWNALNDFAHLEFMSNAIKHKYAALSPVQFVIDTISTMNPVSLLIWLPGIIFPFINKDAKKYRLLAIIFLTVAVILLVNGKSKAEYLVSSFFPIIALGAVSIEYFVKKRGFAWAMYLLQLILVITGITISPLVMPILNPEKYISYSAALGQKPNSSENKKLSEMPQFYADMFGWEDLAKNVSTVYNNLPDSLKNRTIVLGNDYGQAGALEYYSNKYKLPQVVCFHNNYWIWAKKEIKHDYDVYIVIGGTKTEHLESCGEVYYAGMHHTKYAMPYENNLPIFICKKLKVPFKTIIEKEKHFE